MKLFTLLLIILPVWLNLPPATSPPPEGGAPVLNADNVRQLVPIARGDFATLPEDIRINTGWFTLSGDGERIATVRTGGGLVIWSAQGDIIAQVTLTHPAGEVTVLDVRWSDDGEQVAILNTADGLLYFVAVYTLAEDRLITRDLPGGLGVPIRVWLSADNPAQVWLETAPDYLNADENEHLIVQLDLSLDGDSDTLRMIPSAPEADSDAFVRIGRIPAPLAVTSTPDGLVRLWNLETGTLTAEVQLEEVPVFGRVNETTGLQMAWRDQISQALYLLNFDTGENRKIADIGGEYVQAILLSPSADVILAVHMGDDPVVMAWVSATGEQIALGTYRVDCTRVPDMVQLSVDGSTLVIGCDAGLEVWRVAAD